MCPQRQSDYSRNSIIGGVKMTKKELLALAAIVASAYGMDSNQSAKCVMECSSSAYADMKDECFIK